MALSYFDNESINFTENLDFFAKQVVEGFLTGLHKSPFHGFSVEFAEHRMYNNGDSIKNLSETIILVTDLLRSSGLTLALMIGQRRWLEPDSSLRSSLTSPTTPSWGSDLHIFV